MNIEQSQKIENKNSLLNQNENSVKTFKVNGDRSFNFEMLVSETNTNQTDQDIKAVEELMPEDIEEIKEPQKKVATDNVEDEMLINLQNLALNNQIPLHLDKMNDFKLFALKNDFINMDSLRFDIKNMTKEDVDFFKHISSKSEITFNSLKSGEISANVEIVQQSGDISYKSIDFSKGLYNLIEKAYNTQKPVRLDFDNKSSVILKIDNNGKVSAEFMSSDKAMEHILKTNLPNLRNKFDEEKIPYKELAYKDQQNQKRRNQKDNKGG